MPRSRTETMMVKRCSHAKPHDITDCANWNAWNGNTWPWVDGGHLVELGKIRGLWGMGRSRMRMWYKTKSGRSMWKTCSYKCRIWQPPPELPFLFNKYFPFYHFTLLAQSFPVLRFPFHCAWEILFHNSIIITIINSRLDCILPAPVVNTIPHHVQDIQHQRCGLAQ